MTGAAEVNHDARSITVDGTRLTLLTSGSGRMEALLALIAEARTSLRILYYIFGDDAAGRRVRAGLVAAARRGVHVGVLVDGFGSALPDDFFDELKRAGADVCRFLPRYGRRYLLRNHQKLALADGEGEAPRAIVGGFNIESDYFDDGPTGWRDLGLLVEGPAAGRLAGYFDALIRWTHQDKARLRDLGRGLTDWSEPVGGRRAGRIGWLFGGPTRRLSPWARAVRDEMRVGRSLDMIAGYFAPGPRMMRTIERVARRGAARVITPAKADHAAAVAAARHTYARLLRRGVRIAEYQPRKLHTKLFIVGDTVHIGSANFDMRSLFLNLEIMLRVEDAGFAALCRDYFDGEWANGRDIAAADHARAGLLDRLRWSAAYFVMAVVDVRVTRGLNFGVEDGEG